MMGSGGQPNWVAGPQEIALASRRYERPLGGAQSELLKDYYGSFCDMRRASKRSFDGHIARCGIQTSCSEAAKTGFGGPGVANDWSGLRDDISAAHRGEPFQPLGIPERTLPRPSGRTATAASEPIAHRAEAPTKIPCGRTIGQSDVLFAAQVWPR